MEYYLVGEINSHQKIQNTYIKYLLETSMLLRALKGIFKWETTVGTIALCFAMKSSRSKDFPWQLGLPIEWKTNPNKPPKKQKIRRKTSEWHPSYMKCRTMPVNSTPWDISQQILPVRQDVGVVLWRSSYLAKFATMPVCLWAGYAKSI